MKKRNKILFAEYASQFISPANLRFAEYWKIQEVDMNHKTNKH